MLLRKRKITREFIHMLDGWRHSGFSVFAGERIQPREKKSLENLAAYLIRPTFSQQRMEYRADQAKVTYCSKDRKEKKTYDALEWLAAMLCHVPERGQQSVRYYGAYANSTRAGSENGKLRGRTVGSITCPVKTQHSFQYIILLAFQRIPCSRALFLQNTLMHWSISSSRDGHYRFMTTSGPCSR